ncbi:hypothetical protein MF265_22315 [Serratia marcescens]|uniref:hypothetical protein n=1 Tax=Serratia marcescens TaxID=615 RepID=UPI001EF04482|nr:hypothetical protein [Serratia marcescens]ULH10621.1 hypothetical protein MF265_22315 [Serratia marcescens]
MNTYILTLNHVDTPSVTVTTTQDGAIIAVVPVADIPRRVSACEFAGHAGLSLRLMALWLEETPNHSNEDALRFYRWLIAVLFIDEHTHDGDALFVEGAYALPLSLDTLQIVIANNIEGALIEEYGSAQGTINAVVMYQQMVDAPAGCPPSLSAMGRNLLEDLHIAFIRDMTHHTAPAAPVIH